MQPPHHTQHHQQKRKSLANQVHYQKTKVASVVAQNKDLKQKVVDTQKEAYEQEKDFAWLTKRQDEFIEKSNKRSQKASESVCCLVCIHSWSIKFLTSYLVIS